jgi:tRNA G46 methylase TrmB
MPMSEKIQRRLAEFRQADHKVAWLADQWKWRWFHFRHRKQERLNVEFDRRFGVETADELPLMEAGVPREDVARGNGVYRPVTEKLFRTAIASISIDTSKFTFIDVGSGKGKVLFMASDYPFKRIVGIEYAGGLHEVAVRNVAAYRSGQQRCNNVEAVHADALQYEMPAGPLVLFIFNALAKDTMRQLLVQLDAQSASNPDRPMILIYTNLRSVAEVEGVFGGLRSLGVARRHRNFVVIANQAGRAASGRAPS